MGVCCAESVAKQQDFHRSTARLFGRGASYTLPQVAGRAVATPSHGTLLSSAQLLVVALHEIAELSRHRITVHGCEIFAGVLLREFFNDAITEFDERLRDACVQNRDLRSFVAPLEVDAQLTGTVEHLGGFVAEFGVVEKLLHIAQAVAPAVVAVASEDIGVGLFFGIIEEEGFGERAALDLRTRAVVVRIAVAGGAARDLVVIVAVVVGTLADVATLIGIVGIGGLRLPLTPSTSASVVGSAPFQP